MDVSRHRLVSLGSPTEFQRVVAEGGRFSGRFVLLFARSAPETGAVRVGVSASGRAGSKVIRNRLKRLLREASRRCVEDLGPGADVVLIAKAGAVGHRLEELEADVRELFRRARDHLAAGRGSGPP